MTQKTIEELLDETGSLFYKSFGTSMRPLIREGKDCIYIKKRPPERLNKNDVVLFIRPRKKGRDQYVLHRILKVNPDGTYWIVGDNCTIGETVREKNILGVLDAVMRGNRTVRVSDPGYRLYVSLWGAPYKFRFFVLRHRRHLKRTGKKLLRRLHR